MRSASRSAWRMKKQQAVVYSASIELTDRARAPRPPASQQQSRFGVRPLAPRPMRPSTDQFHMG
jgi:hypothetical protein